MGYLYKLDFASGKSYIVITRDESLVYRMRVHRCAAMKRGSELAVHRAWRKYGEPTVTPLAIASAGFLPELEQRAVAVFGTYGAGGYNMTPGGEFNTSFSPEVLARISFASKNRKPPSEATRAKMSASGKLRIFTPEHRANIAAAKTGSKHSPETIAKLKGRIRSSEHRQAIAFAKWRSQHNVLVWACSA